MLGRPDRLNSTQVLARLALTFAGGCLTAPLEAQESYERADRESRASRVEASRQAAEAGRYPDEASRSHGHAGQRARDVAEMVAGFPRSFGEDPQPETYASRPDDQTALQSSIMALGRREAPQSVPASTPRDPAPSQPVAAAPPPERFEPGAPPDPMSPSAPASMPDPTEPPHDAPPAATADDPRDEPVPGSHAASTLRQEAGSSDAALETVERGGANRPIQVLAGIVATLAAGLSLLGTRLRAAPSETTNLASAPEKQPKIYGEEIAEPTHHCRGHRLAIVVGSRADPSITMARNWIQNDPHIQHKLYIETLGDKQPDLGAAYAMEDLATALNAPTRGQSRPRAMRDAIEGFFATHATCCCHWDEVIVVMHGGTKFKWHWLLKNLPNLLNDRPLTKFVLWMCGSADQFYPGKTAQVRGQSDDGKAQKFSGEPGGRESTGPYVKVFEQIAWLLRPKSCHAADHCGCSAEHCTAFNADGAASTQCPDGSQPVTLLCSSWTEGRLKDTLNVRRKAAASLGILPAANGRPVVLTAPEGRLRRVEIHADGSVTSADLNNAQGLDVFAGTRLESSGEPPFVDPEDVIGDFRRFADPTRIEQPGNLPEAAGYGGGKYQGPNGCQPGDRPARAM